MFSLSSHTSIYSLSKSLPKLPKYHYSLAKLSKCHYLVGNNIKLAKFTKMSLLGWQEYKVSQIYKFAIGLFWVLLILGFWGLFLFWAFNY
jgi:hypothetical protein